VVLLTCFCSVYLLNDGYDGYPLRENVTRFPGAQDWRRMCVDGGRGLLARLVAKPVRGWLCAQVTSWMCIVFAR
jgi:hypothetical protein